MSDDDSESVSREASPCSESPRPVSLGSESPVDNNIHTSVMTSTAMSTCSAAMQDHAKVNKKNSRKFFHLFFAPEVFPIFLGPIHFNKNYLIIPIKSFQVTVATQTGHDSPDFAFNPDKMTTDKHCYECKVRYRDPKPQDLVMYLHAWKYQVKIRKNLFFFRSSFSENIK